MISQFPQFKELELVDKEEIEQFTSKYPPYSDFNFISMWSWDVNRDMRISKLNNNLVVRFTDYLTGSPFFSFLGDNMANETASTLLEFSKQEGINAELKLIPEEVVKILDQNKFKIVEDRDHFDYIFDLEKISLFEGSEYGKKRNEISKFLRHHEGIETKRIDVLDTKTKEAILKLNNFWLENKKTKDPFFDIKNELIAIERFLNMNPENLHILGIFSNGELIAYSVNEICNSEYATGHFYKVDKHNGIFTFLMKESASFLASFNVKFLNFEQDLGIEGLRNSKKLYKPVNFLKKYLISLK